MAQGVVQLQIKHLVKPIGEPFGDLGCSGVFHLLVFGIGKLFFQWLLNFLNSLFVYSDPLFAGP